MVRFLNELYSKHSKLCTVMLLLILAVLIIGGLSIVDAVQKEQRDKNTYTVELHEYDEIPAFNVEGLTDEEIEKYLEEYRNNQKKAGE